MDSIDPSEPNSNRLAKQRDGNGPAWLRTTCSYVAEAIRRTAEAAVVFAGDAPLFFIDPMGSIAPIDPIDPTDRVDPSDPTVPIDPTGPIDSTDLAWILLILVNQSIINHPST